jgi:hypothetical protein
MKIYIRISICKFVGQELLRCLYPQPTVSTKQVQDRLGVTHPPADALISSFQKAGLLKEVTGYKRSRLFSFAEYLRIFKQ